MPTPRLACFPLTPARETGLRARVIAEALSWIGTPYRDQGAVKGGAVDCCMLLVRAWIDAGVVEPFDPRPYNAARLFHGEEEFYLAWIETIAVEVETWRPGDLVMWRFGRCFSHSGIIVNELGHVAHALAMHGTCSVTDMDEAFLMYLDRSGKRFRPRKFFDPWARVRDL